MVLFELKCLDDKHPIPENPDMHWVYSTHHELTLDKFNKKLLYYVTNYMERISTSNADESVLLSDLTIYPRFVFEKVFEYYKIVSPYLFTIVYSF